MPTPPKNRYRSERHGRTRKPTPKAAAAAEDTAKSKKGAKVSDKPTLNISKVNDDENDLPCNLCASMVTKDHNNPIRCDSCEKWYHIECTDLNIEAFNFLEKSVSLHPGIKWFCCKCIEGAEVSSTRLDDHATRQDAKIYKLGSMFEDIQKRMDTIMDRDITSI